MAAEKADVWMGFACRQCGAPLAVQRVTEASKSSDRAARGWRVTCTRLWGDGVSRARNAHGTDHDFNMKHDHLRLTGADSQARYFFTSDSQIRICTKHTTALRGWGKEPVCYH
jgi:hypothetical protein